MDQLATHSFLLLLIASLFTYLATVLGAAVVFCFKSINQRPLDIMLSISAGLMTAAAVWSLILPATTLSNELWHNAWLAPTLGLLAGGCFIILSSLIIDKKFPGADAKKRTILIIGVMPLHNIPEGLAVGVSFSALAMGIDGCSLSNALMVALGIGIQNFPDGTSVAVPLYRDGMSKTKSFLIAQSSGIMEFFAALFGYFVTITARNILPIALAFAAGAMLSVVASELIPDIAPANRTFATLGFILGFAIMMVLDLAITV
ncbi:MAG: ZIP family metal transporter [Eubacteriales bacterium]|nr:ZIP family metal transporter [Eubacteriales bacterium]